MIYSILYAVLAILALGVLVFVHELGHYFMARREGMRVEAFSIGFGKPLWVWKKGDVLWQLCWIPFGGYVKIAGMEQKGSRDPHEIPDGFYGKSPLSRIKVALAGPVINILLAFVVFCFIWMAGGREKPFAECTHLIGWIDPQSEAYKSGIRPGDEIETYAGKTFTGFNQIAAAAILDQGPYVVTGERIQYFEGVKTPFSYTFDLGETLTGLDKMFVLQRMIAPANYLIYDSRLGSLEESPMENSGIQDQDRVIWVDGELVFSRQELSSLINQSKALLTIERDGKTFLARIPRLHVGDLRLNAADSAEFQDLKYAMKMSEPVASLFFIPYVLSDLCVVANPVPYIDEMALERKCFSPSGGSLETPLLPGDRILAVDGVRVSSLQSFFAAIQKRKVQMIVLRGGHYDPVSWRQADMDFMQGVSFSDLEKLICSIGLDSRLSDLGNLCLLAPVEPKPRYEFPLTYSLKDRVANAVLSQKKQKTGQAPSEEEISALRKLEAAQKQVMLGLPLKDRVVDYNPSPFQLMISSLQETWKMLYAMVTGYASPKYFSGPVGIVQVIHQGWADGIKEALFLIGAISFNLGIVNLLPIPVLDGGHICFSLYEMITKKKIAAKTMEKMIIPFFVLFIAFFIYLTYQDIIRLLSRFF